MERRPSTQRGVALFITLIMLVAMTVAALSLVRIVDSGNIIAGNLAFRQATLQATDFGIEAAREALVEITSSLSKSNQPWASDNTACQPGTTQKTGCQYFPVMVKTDSLGAQDIDWSASPDIIPGIVSKSGGTLTSSNAINSYQVKYFIDRLCDTTVDSSGIASLTTKEMPEKCLANFEIDEGANRANTGGITKKPFDEKSTYYRVTVRADGPRGTTTQVQVVMFKPT